MSHWPGVYQARQCGWPVRDLPGSVSPGLALPEMPPHPAFGGRDRTQIPILISEVFTDRDVSLAPFLRYIHVFSQSQFHPQFIYARTHAHTHAPIHTSASNLELNGEEPCWGDVTDKQPLCAKCLSHPSSFNLTPPTTPLHTPVAVRIFSSLEKGNRKGNLLETAQLAS